MKFNQEGGTKTVKANVSFQNKVFTMRGNMSVQAFLK
jgi:hypothetical protein